MNYTMMHGSTNIKFILTTLLSVLLLSQYNERLVNLTLVRNIKT